jgi:hypothetical protein
MSTIHFKGNVMNTFEILLQLPYTIMITCIRDIFVHLDAVSQVMTYDGRLIDMPQTRLLGLFFGSKDCKVMLLMHTTIFIVNLPTCCRHRFSSQGSLNLSLNGYRRKSW